MRKHSSAHQFWRSYRTFLQSKECYDIVLLTLFAIIAAVHLTARTDIPFGYTVDEIANALNAYSIKEFGQDQFGTPYPMYFESYGDFKPPLLIYTMAGLFHIFPLTEFSIRIPGLLFFGILLVLQLFLLRRLFPKNPWVVFFGIATTGFIPWVFQLSRITLVPIMFTGFTTLALLCTHALLRNTYTKTRDSFLAGGLGFLLGFSVLSYHHAQLLNPVFLCSVLLVIGARKQWRRCIQIIAGFFVGAGPYVYALFVLPEGPLVRTYDAIYIDDKLQLSKKIWRFIDYYSSYFSPDFLLFKGDYIGRVNPGFMGECFFIIFALAATYLLCFAIKIIRRKPIPLFHYFLVFHFFFTPIAGSAGDHDRATYSINMAIYAIIFSCYSIVWLQDIFPKYKAQITATLIAILLLESGIYMQYYFYTYPMNISLARWFDHSGVTEGFHFCMQHDVDRIVLQKRVERSRLYSIMYREQTDIPIVHLEKIRKPQSGDCVLYYHVKWHEMPLKQLLEFQKKPNRSICGDSSMLFPSEQHPAPFHNFRKWHTCIVE